MSAASLYRNIIESLKVLKKSQFSNHNLRIINSISYQYLYNRIKFIIIIHNYYNSSLQT